MTENDHLLAKDPHRRDLIAACSLKPSTLFKACGLGAVPSERDRLRCRTPGSVAEWMAIQKRLAELEEQ